ncbi:MAG: lipid-A-disaccharide synthase [Alphaproteobacteria bacterium]|nr:lipid-A-disaccharide synthase [Alphaproteobacteria bacterium]OJV14251.1 MAG: lipid-A-disaccharide synthase [Alphaproteobacteria bacterium 33-17]
MEFAGSHSLKPNKKIYVICGENSGDNILSLIVERLQAEYAGCEIRGVTGPKLEKLNVKSLFSIYKIAVMGFFEVLPKIFEILKLIKFTANDIAKFNPDLIITVDSPDFCFRVIKNVRTNYPDLKAKIVHIVAPSVWAYRENRAEKVAKLYDHLLCFLPFEPPYFTKHGMKADFIGHPIVENLLKYKQNHVRDKNILLAMPGSRLGEVKRHWQVFIRVFKKLKKDNPDLKIKVPIPERLKEYLEKNTPKNLDIKFVINEQEKFDLYNKAGLGIIKSGTSALEAAVFNCPMVVVYKVNKLTAFLAKRMLKIKTFTLINIVADQDIIKELIQENFTADNLYKEAVNILNSDKIIDYSEYINKLKTDNSSIENAMNIFRGYL